MQLISRRYQNYVWLVPLFSVALVYQITYTVVAFQLALDPAKHVDVPFAMWNGTVATVNSAAVTAGLAPGDRIVTVNGHPIHSDREFYAAWKAHNPNSRVLVQVRSPSGPLRTIRLLTPAPRQAQSLKDWITTTIFVAISLLCVLTGIYVAAVLPNDPRALSFFGLMLGMAGVVTDAQWFEFPSWAAFAGEAFFFARALAWPIALVCFSLYFPEQFAWDQKRPWLKRVVLILIAVLLGLLWLNGLPAYFSYEAVPLRTMPKFLPAIISLVIAAAITFFFAATGFKIGRVQSRDSRRRLRILLFGSFVALTPLGVAIAYSAISRQAVEALPEEVIVTCALIFCLFPITVAYVVAVDRAMDLRVAIRQGVRYAFAKGSLRLILGLAAAAILLALNNFLFASEMHRLGPALDRDVEIGIYVAAVFFVVFLVRRTGTRLMVWVDRKFFRGSLQFAETPGAVERKRARHGG